MYLYDDTKCLICRAELHYWDPKGHLGNPKDNMGDWIEGVAQYDERCKPIKRRRDLHPWDNDRYLRSGIHHPRR
jgi:hypothetical protein